MKNILLKLKNNQSSIMKTHFFYTILLGLFLSIHIYSSAQSYSKNANLNDYAKKYIAFSKEFPQEKVYLHFDNTEYYQGETIWFKAYVVRADRNSLSEMSKILHVELVTPEGRIIETLKLKIENGQCHGDFNIEKTGYGGFFEVRAYTRYMLNFAENNYFSRVFPVYDKPLDTKNSDQKISQKPAHLSIPQVRSKFLQKDKLALYFYPEGGNLVHGITSQVAFKAIDNKGENAIASGYLMNEKGEKISEISTEYNGMGMFSFLPDSGKYSIKIPYENKEYTFALPKILPIGMVMNVNNFNKEKVNITIQKSEKFTLDSLGIMFTNRGILYGFEKISFDSEDMLYFSFPKKMLPSGITQITLFDSQGNVLAERMIFINHHSEMKMEVVQNKPSYLPFDKIGLVFSVKDKNEHPVETNLSVAVRDASSCANNPLANNILTDLLLTSDLKGYIENPAFYFEKDDKTHHYALDLLMLTQGWSKYNWKKMTGITPTTITHPMEKGLYIDGAVSSLIRKKPLPNIDVLMFLTGDSTSQHGRTLTDSLGKFNFSFSDFIGKHKLSIQTKENEKRKDNNIILDRVFSPPFKMYAYEEQLYPESKTLKNNNLTENTNSSTDTDNYLDSLMTKSTTNEKIRLINEVIIKQKQKYSIESEGLQNASIVYDVQETIDNLIDSNGEEPYDMLDFLLKENPYFSFEVITSVNPESTNDRYKVKATYKGRNVIFCINNKPLFLGFDITDKRALCDYDELTSYSVNDITTVAITEGEGNSLMIGINNAATDMKGNEVLVYLYTDKTKPYNIKLKGIRQTKFMGYSPVKEFYNIPYDIIPPEDTDHRRTLYWNPNVKTDANGKASFTFFNNSLCKTINISAETVTQNGIIGTLNK